MLIPEKLTFILFFQTLTSGINKSVNPVHRTSIGRTSAIGFYPRLTHFSKRFPLDRILSKSFHFGAGGKRKFKMTSAKERGRIVHSFS